MMLMPQGASRAFRPSPVSLGTFSGTLRAISQTLRPIESYLLMLRVTPQTGSVSIGLVTSGRA